jgi:hypothetical protein
MFLLRKLPKNSISARKRSAAHSTNITKLMISTIPLHVQVAPENYPCVILFGKFEWGYILTHPSYNATYSQMSQSGLCEMSSSMKAYLAAAAADAISLHQHTSRSVWNGI